MFGRTKTKQREIGITGGGKTELQIPISLMKDKVLGTPWYCPTN